MALERNPTWLCVVALALAAPDGRWLMQRRPPGKHHAGLWEFPGGKVESGETPACALVREIAEELGIAVEEHDLHPAGFAEGGHDSHGIPIVILLYTASRWNGTPRAVEGGAVQWFAPGEIGMLDRPPLDRDLCASLFERGDQAAGKEGCQG